MTAERTGGLCVPCKEGRRVERKRTLHEVKPGRNVDGMSILIEKDAETSEHADYFFTADVWDKDPRFKSRSMIVGQSKGLFRIRKKDGEIELLAPMPEDTGSRRFHRAANTVRKAWESGELPERTSFQCG